MALSAARRRSCIFSRSIVSEGTVDALPTHKLVVALDPVYAFGGKHFGVQHAHLKLPCFLSEEDRCLFNRFCHVVTSLSVLGATPLVRNRMYFNISAHCNQATQQIFSLPLPRSTHSPAPFYATPRRLAAPACVSGADARPQKRCDESIADAI